jgi:hypothetical protein
MAIVATQLFDEESLETNEQMFSNIGGAANKLVRLLAQHWKAKLSSRLGQLPHLPI